MTTSPSHATGRSTTGASSAPGPTPGVGDADSPSTPQEAATQFEEVLVRQFVKVMTKDMFSNSLAGEGGGNWMQGQRDRQRDVLTDMITDRIVEADTLEISETLANEWGETGSMTDGSDSAPPTQGEPHPTAPSETTDAPRPLIDTPPATHDNSKIDRVV